VLLDEPGDLARAGQHRLDVQAGQRLQFVQGVNVERVAGGDDERAVVRATAASGRGGAPAAVGMAVLVSTSGIPRWSALDRSTSFSSPNSSASPCGEKQKRHG
jgi:hypothetical protein